jgi:hypothetical protein
MKRIGKVLKISFWAVTALAMILALSAATYAWFSNNRVTKTDSVSGRTEGDTVELQISSTGGTDFNPQSEAAIIQVNSADITSLQPVSTSDLNTFVYNRNTINDQATAFEVVENEQYYYHGRIYVRAVADEADTDGKMALYLDQGSESGGAIAQTASGDLLNAARLGLTFDDGTSVIFRLSETNNKTKNQVLNTVVNGKTLGNNQVLGYSGGSVKAVDDPAVSLASYTITLENNTATLPDAPLIYLELNRIYTVDIYLYLEGCDPDCSDSVSYDTGDLHLAFYGILQ